MRDRAVQRLVRAAHLVDLVDGVQRRGLMPAAKLPANFLERRPGELPRNVHRDLARKEVGAPVGAHCELAVAHLSQIEVFAHRWH